MTLADLADISRLCVKDMTSFTSQNMQNRLISQLRKDPTITRRMPSADMNLKYIFLQSNHNSAFRGFAPGLADAEGKGGKAGAQGGRASNGRIFRSMELRGEREGGNWRKWRKISTADEIKMGVGFLFSQRFCSSCARPLLRLPPPFLRIALLVLRGVTSFLDFSTVL